MEGAVGLDVLEAKAASAFGLEVSKRQATMQLNSLEELELTTQMEDQLLVGVLGGPWAQRLACSSLSVPECLHLLLLDCCFPMFFNGIHRVSEDQGLELTYSSSLVAGLKLKRHGACLGQGLSPTLPEVCLLLARLGLAIDRESLWGA